MGRSKTSAGSVMSNESMLFLLANLRHKHAGTLLSVGVCTSVIVEVGWDAGMNDVLPFVGLTSCILEASASFECVSVGAVMASS